MKKKLITSLFIIIELIVFSGLFFCNDKTEIQTISEEKFVKIYCDVASYSDIIDKKLRRSLVDSIFNFYEVTNEKFENTKKLYSQDPKKWKAVFEKIVNELEKRKTEFEQHSDSIKTIKNNVEK